MTKMRHAWVTSVLAMGLGVVYPAALWAAEHGGASVATQEHGGKSGAVHEGSHGMEVDEATLLREAAAALRKGQARPDLAAKLEQLAKEHSPQGR